MKNLEYLKAWLDGKDVQVYDIAFELDSWDPTRFFGKLPPGSWRNLTPLKQATCCHPFYDTEDYRLKPAVFTINGYEVPEPCREPLEKHERYWYPSCGYSPVETSVWDGFINDHTLLSQGLIHKTKEAAEAHAEALLSFTKRG